MHTNLYLVLEEACTWAVARKAQLSCTFALNGDFVLRGYKVGAKPEDSPETAQWVVTVIELRKGFFSPVAPVLGSTPKPDEYVGTQLMGLMGAPLGLLRLSHALTDETNPLTVAILAQTVECRSKLDAGQPIYPW